MSSRVEVSPEIIVQPAAEAEIAEAFRWYEDKCDGLGSESCLALDSTFSAIQRNLASFPVIRKQVRRVLLRRFPYGVFYMHESEQIVVIASFRASREPKRWQDRL